MSLSLIFGPPLLLNSVSRKCLWDLLKAPPFTPVTPDYPGDLLIDWALWILSRSSCSLSLLVNFRFHRTFLPLFGWTYIEDCGQDCGHVHNPHFWGLRTCPQSPFFRWSWGENGFQRCLKVVIRCEGWISVPPGGRICLCVTGVSHTQTFVEMFLLQEVKGELQRIYMNGCRCNERLNSKTEGSKLHLNTGFRG